MTCFASITPAVPGRRGPCGHPLQSAWPPHARAAGRSTSCSRPLLDASRVPLAITAPDALDEQAPRDVHRDARLPARRRLRVICLDLEDRIGARAPGNTGNFRGSRAGVTPGRSNTMMPASKKLASRPSREGEGRGERLAGGVFLDHQQNRLGHGRCGQAQECRDDKGRAEQCPGAYRAFHVYQYRHRGPIIPHLMKHLRDDTFLGHYMNDMSTSDRAARSARTTPSHCSISSRSWSAGDG